MSRWADISTRHIWLRARRLSHVQQRHLEAMRRAVAAIATRGALRPGLGLDEAADALYALAGTEVYRALTQERGWPPARYEQWFFELASRELLAQSR